MALRSKRQKRISASEKKSIYLDHAASTPVDPRVLRAMLPFFSDRFGNPGSLHSFGQEAISALDDSREKIARSVGVDFRNVIFTGSATEANNLALRGVLKKFRESGQVWRPKIVISAIEHESVLETAKDLEREGVEVSILPVDQKGFVRLSELEKILDERTILVSIMYANNETGAIQPISEISEILKKSRTTKYPLLHTDAVQAFQYLNCDLNDLGVDLLTLSAHKIYGPKGVGALVLRNDASVLAPLITGGGQEHLFRSGTENIPLVVGFAKAAEVALELREAERDRVFDLKLRFWKGLSALSSGIKANCPPASKDYLPNILNIHLQGEMGEDILTKLDLSGLSVSSGSACQARSSEPSHVLKAMGFETERSRKSIRISLGRQTDKLKVDEALLRIKVLVDRSKRSKK